MKKVTGRPSGGVSSYGGLVIECVDVSVAAQDEVGAGDEDTGGEAHQGQTGAGV